METKYENTLFYQIHSCAKCFDILFEQLFKELNIEISTIEHLTLSIISDVKECCQRDLAKILLKDRANTGKLALNLEKKGLIKITLKTKNNRPVKILTLTQKGKKLLEKTDKVLLPIIQKLHNLFQKNEIEDIKIKLKNFREKVEKTIKTNI